MIRAVPTKATFVVRDDMGQPVAKATIDGGFADVSQSGARDRFKSFTDANGMFVAKGHAVLDVGAQLRKDGYYQTTTIVPLDPELRAKLDRWDVQIPVLLKRIRSPIAMYAKKVENYTIRNRTGDKSGNYVTNSVVGYDLVQGEMVVPYGCGQVADLDLRWRMNIISKDSDGSPVEFDTLFEARMTNVVNGICRGTPDGSEDGQTGSSYFSDYNAPTGGYTNCISLYHIRKKKVESNDDQHYLYYFRIRTQTNELGQVTNALYGKICGQINGNFRYYLNPTPNERNVEFDPKRNLFKNLGRLEQVYTP
jgi:hypothetical protein